MFPFLEKLRTGLFLALFPFLISGCAFRQIIFDKLDWVVMYQIDSYLDLEKEQKLKLKGSIAEAVTWMKKEQFPGALQVLGQLETAARQRKLDDSHNKLLSDEVKRIRKDLLTRYERPILDVLTSLKSGQIDHLAEKLKDSNEKIEDVLESKDFEDDYQDVMKKQLKTLEEWYGELNKSQKDLYFQSMRLTRAEVANRLTQRQRTQAHILDTLRSRDAVRVRTMVASFRDHGEIWQDPSYAQYRDASERRWEVYLKTLHAGLSDKQWTHLEKKLHDFRSDLEGMLTKA